MVYRKHMYSVWSLCFLAMAFAIAFALHCSDASMPEKTLPYCILFALVGWNVFMLFYYVKVDERGITVSCPEGFSTLFKTEFFPWDGFDEHSFTFDISSCCLPKTAKEAFREPATFGYVSGIRRVFPVCSFGAGKEIIGDFVLYNNVCATKGCVWVNGKPIWTASDGGDGSCGRFYKKAFFDSDNNLMNDVDGRYVKYDALYSADGKMMYCAHRRYNVVVLSDGKVDEEARMFKKAYFDNNTGRCYGEDCVLERGGKMYYISENVYLSHVICDPLPFSKAVNSCSGRSLIDLDKVAEMSRLGRQCVFIWWVRDVFMLLLAVFTAWFLHWVKSHR